MTTVAALTTPAVALAAPPVTLCSSTATTRRDQPLAKPHLMKESGCRGQQEEQEVRNQKIISDRCPPPAGSGDDQPG